MTSLLKEQAVKVRLVSTSVTARLGLSRLTKRAQVAPANPPPITTTRPKPWAKAGADNSTPAAAPLPRNCRRVAWAIGCSLILLRRVPRGDRFDFVVGEALGDAIHRGRRLLAGAERLQRGDDRLRVLACQSRHRSVDRGRAGVTARTGERARRSIRDV